MGVSGERISPDFALCTPRPPCLLPSLAAPLPFAEYVSGLFENAPFWLRCNGLCSPFLLKLSPLVARPASMVSHLPPCLNGHTSALYASMVSHSPPCLNGHTFAAMPRWSHLCRRASMVTHLPPCLNGLTIPSTPHALTNCPAAPSAPRKPPFSVSLLPLGLAPRLSCLVIQRAAKRGGGLHARIRCVWQSATHIEDVARLTI